MSRRSLSVMSVFLLLTLVIDQVSKYYAREIILNQGVSFGLFPSSLLTFALAGVLVIIALKFGKAFLSSSPVATGIFFGSSLSNLLDRVLYGGVRDFLWVPIFSVRNNLADWAIILSLIWLFFRAQRVIRPDKV